MRTEDLWQVGLGGGYIEPIDPSGFDILIKGSNRYLNFGSISGSSGYGFRDNGGTMQFKNLAGAWTAFGAGGGGGDVVGPTSSVDSRVVAFDGITGKLIKDSGILMSDIFNKSVDDTDDITVGATNKFATAAEKTKLGFIIVTQAVDLDVIESDTVVNNAKVTNATHTGEVTGSGILKVDKTAITNKLGVVPVGADYILFSDTSDSGNLKKALISDLPGGGGGTIVTKGQAEVDFGATEDSIAVVTVATALAVVDSVIVISPAGTTTADHDPDDYQWDDIKGYVSNIIDGVSFDIIGVAPNGSWGKYLFNYLIV